MIEGCADFLILEAGGKDGGDMEVSEVAKRNYILHTFPKQVLVFFLGTQYVPSEYHIFLCQRIEPGEEGVAQDICINPSQGEEDVPPLLSHAEVNDFFLIASHE